MTVKEVLSVLRHSEGIKIDWGSNDMEASPDDHVFFNAFGDFEVDEVTSDQPRKFCIYLKMCPAKVGG